MMTGGGVNLPGPECTIAPMTTEVAQVRSFMSNAMLLCFAKWNIVCVDAPCGLCSNVQCLEEIRFESDVIQWRLRL